MAHQQTHKLLDITPTPDVLIALTRTPIVPLDALSELIDNAIDSFRAGELAGRPSRVRQVIIDIPGVAEVARGDGVVRVRDTGPGLTEEQIAKAMTAGYSDKNHFDTLGLFGMGFNIATGKIGRETKIISALAGADKAIQVTLDLPKLIRERNFSVLASQIEKPIGLEHGTLVEVRGWWPDGDANSGFVRDLTKVSKRVLRESVGRRYATLLRGDAGPIVNITINGERCTPFEHCVWSEARFVERRKPDASTGSDRTERVPARISIDQVIDKSRRCLRDGTEFGVSAECPRCGSLESRDVEQRIRGWLGIQRFDHKDDFGIDLIRNGRAIRAGEKSAFFEFTDEATGRSEREYPIDQQYGRIVGEVHLDQVPVDFQKQHFQQTSQEWKAAMRFLRGGSLLPTNWPLGEPNESPISRLRRGYGKVRNFGKADLYMGVYNTNKGKAERISREKEQELYQRFLAKEPGYYDDARWWDLVVSATEQPIQDLPECATCGYQNPEGTEECGGCGAILFGRTCVNAACTQLISRSATACPHCGAQQTIEIMVPWTCYFCDTENKAGEEICRTCTSVKGAPHPAGKEALDAVSTEQPDLSARHVVVTLANGKPSNPLDVHVRGVSHRINAAYGRDPVPLVTTARPGSITVYVDLNHSAFAGLGLKPEYLIASEAAQYLHVLHSELQGRPGHTIAALTAELLRSGWAEALAESPGSVRDDITKLFLEIATRLTDAPHAEDFYGELDEAQQKHMADNMIKSGVDLAEISNLKRNGRYLQYCSRDALATFFSKYPAGWFDGRVWQDPWPEPELVGPVVAARLQAEISLKYLRCIEDCASYLRFEQPERLIVVRARAAAEFLGDKLS